MRRTPTVFLIAAALLAAELHTKCVALDDNTLRIISEPAPRRPRPRPPIQPDNHSQLPKDFEPFKGKVYFGLFVGSASSAEFIETGATIGTEHKHHKVTIGAKADTFIIKAIRTNKLLIQSELSTYLGYEIFDWTPYARTGIQLNLGDLEHEESLSPFIGFGVRKSITNDTSLSGEIKFYDLKRKNLDYSSIAIRITKEY